MASTIEKYFGEAVKSEGETTFVDLIVIPVGQEEAVDAVFRVAVSTFTTGTSGSNGNGSMTIHAFAMRDDSPSTSKVDIDVANADLLQDAVHGNQFQVVYSSDALRLQIHWGGPGGGDDWHFVAEATAIRRGQ